MFDVSYGAAWQLGQLLVLQSLGIANQLYQWRRAMMMQQASAAEEAVLARRLGGAAVFESVLGPRRAALEAGAPALPDEVAAWFRELGVLAGVPFNYLVPDERMLPPESIRFFHLDRGWIDAMIDGALSIGRAGSQEPHAAEVRRIARTGGRGGAARGEAAGGGVVTGFLIRSAAVSGWPNLRFMGYADAAATVELAPRRVARLSGDTTMCMFDGEIASVRLREPPEQLHLGLEGAAGGHYTTLRSVNGGPGTPAGALYTTSPVRRVTACDPAGTRPRVCIPMRRDGRTVIVATAAAEIRARLAADFGQVFPGGFTSAELALELIRGLVDVEYRR